MRLIVKISPASSFILNCRILGVNFSPVGNQQSTAIGIRGIVCIGSSIGVEGAFGGLDIGMCLFFSFLNSLYTYYTNICSISQHKYLGNDINEIDKSLWKFVPYLHMYFFIIYTKTNLGGINHGVKIYKKQDDRGEGGVNYK